MKKKRKQKQAEVKDYLKVYSNDIVQKYRDRVEQVGSREFASAIYKVAYESKYYALPWVVGWNYLIQ